MIRGRGVLATLLTAATLAAAGAGPARAVVPAGNLLLNGNAESGTGASNTTTVSPVPIPDWSTTAGFTELAYGQPGLSQTPDTTQSAAIGGGAQFFAGGPFDGVNTVQTATQTVDVTQAAPEIDRGGVLATLSADLGGWYYQEDHATVTATFLDVASQQLGSLAIGPVTAEDRDRITELLPRSGTAAVPAGTRTIRVVMTATYAEGSYNDGYLDNVSLTLVPPPVPGKSVNVAVVSGAVLVKPPGTQAFGQLRSGEQIPLGSTVDATRGVVAMTSAKDRRGRTASGQFHAGEFRVSQVAANRTELTVLTLARPRLAACARRHAGIARAGGPRHLSLWGSASGGFRTVGRYGSATERGTTWLTQDTCAGTLIRVTRDAVTVDDFAHHRILVVRAPHTYLARPGKGG